MSIESLISELMATVAANTAATEANTAICERIVAGQDQALAKLEGASGTTTRAKRETAAEKKVREAAEAAAAQTGGTTTTETTTTAATTAPVHPLLAAPNAETKPVTNEKTQKTEDTPTANYRAADFSRDQVKNEFVGWLGEVPEADEIKKRREFVVALGEHFGVKQIFGDGVLDEEQRKQVLFYLRRKREGLKVDFSTEYDFDGDPLADQTTDEDGGASDDDLLG